jgi:hypothetical protein
VKAWRRDGVLAWVIGIGEGRGNCVGARMTRRGGRDEHGEMLEQRYEVQPRRVISVSASEPGFSTEGGTDGVGGLGMYEPCIRHFDVGFTKLES